MLIGTTTSDRARRGEDDLLFQDIEHVCGRSGSVRLGCLGAFANLKSLGFGSMAAGAAAEQQLQQQQWNQLAKQFHQQPQQGSQSLYERQLEARRLREQQLQQQQARQQQLQQQQQARQQQLQQQQWAQQQASRVRQCQGNATTITTIVCRAPRRRTLIRVLVSQTHLLEPSAPVKRRCV